MSLYDWFLFFIGSLAVLLGYSAENLYIFIMGNSLIIISFLSFAWENIVDRLLELKGGKNKCH